MHNIHTHFIDGIGLVWLKRCGGESGGEVEMKVGRDTKLVEAVEGRSEGWNLGA